MLSHEERLERIASELTDYMIPVEKPVRLRSESLRAHSPPSSSHTSTNVPPAFSSSHHSPTNATSAFSSSHHHLPGAPLSPLLENETSFPSFPTPLTLPSRREEASSMSSHRKSASLSSSSPSSRSHLNDSASSFYWWSRGMIDCDRDLGITYDHDVEFQVGLRAFQVDRLQLELSLTTW